MTTALHEDLDGQVALVTGATRGIGRQVAANLAKLGARVYAGARDTDDMDLAGVEAVELDVTEPAHAGHVADRIQEDAGRLDVLVNNAGVYGDAHRPLNVDVDEFERILGTNLTGAFRVARATMPMLTARPGGRVVNVSSGAGSFADGLYAHHTPYAVSKAGLNALTVCLAKAYRDTGLIVNSVCPGWVRTDMGGEDARRPVEKGAETPTWLARFQEGSPSGRFWRDQKEIPW